MAARAKCFSGYMWLALSNRSHSNYINLFVLQLVSLMVTTVSLLMIVTEEEMKMRKVSSSSNRSSVSVKTTAAVELCLATT